MKSNKIYITIQSIVQMIVSINKGREDGEEVILTSSHQGENLHCNTDVENNRMDDYQGKHLAYVFFA